MKPVTKGRPSRNNGHDRSIKKATVERVFSMWLTLSDEAKVDALGKMIHTWESNARIAQFRGGRKSGRS